MTCHVVRDLLIDELIGQYLAKLAAKIYAFYSKIYVFFVFG